MAHLRLAHAAEVREHAPCPQPTRPAHLRLVHTGQPAQAAPERVDTRGKVDGFRDYEVSTHRCSREWRDAVAKVEAARHALNAHLVGAKPGDNYVALSRLSLDLSDPDTSDALRAYHVALSGLLQVKVIRPAHMRALIYAAREIMGLSTEFAPTDSLAAAAMAALDNAAFRMTWAMENSQ